MTNRKNAIVKMVEIKMSSIFLSHNSKDKKFVRELDNRLKNYNVKPDTF